MRRLLSPKLEQIGGLRLVLAFMPPKPLCETLSQGTICVVAVSNPSHQTSYTCRLGWLVLRHLTDIHCVVWTRTMCVCSALCARACAVCGVSWGVLFPLLLLLLVLYAQIVSFGAPDAGTPLLLRASFFWLRCCYSALWCAWGCALRCCWLYCFEKMSFGWPVPQGFARVSKIDLPGQTRKPPPLT